MKPLAPVAAGLLMALSSMAQETIHLKSRDIVTTRQADLSLMPRHRGLSGTGRIHEIVQFAAAPAAADVAALQARGAIVLHYVHENALLISVDRSASLGGVRPIWIGELQSADKLSAAVDWSAISETLIVEFHADVDMHSARALMLILGLQLRDHPDLKANHLLVEGTPDQFRAAAEHDEVAYIFPASDQLLNGQPTYGCASALTMQGPVGQYVATMGDGWDGPGQGSASVGYLFSKVIDKLPADSAESEIVRAFNEWAKHAKLTFSQAPSATSSHTINVLFASGNHGDGYPFDGAGGVLAHTFYPAPPNPEPLAGDMHFDADESWHIGADTDVFSVALHEAGHALGLGHSDDPAAVMYPYYGRHTTLQADDIKALLTLYAAQDGTGTASPSTPLSLSVDPVAATTAAPSIAISGTTAGGTGTVAVSWRSSQGQAGTAQGARPWSTNVPLGLGTNNLTITAATSSESISTALTVTRQASTPPPAPAQPPTIQITSPTAGTSVTTQQKTITVAGTAAQASGIARVTWTTPASSGQATGTTSWYAANIPLGSGTTMITVQAFAVDGTSAARTLQVTYAPPTRKDTTPPALTILSPSSNTLGTSASSIVISGIASDNVGVSSVTWSTGISSGTATGTTNWTTGSIPLFVGYNSIVLRAFDAAGNSTWRSITVTRR